MIRRLVYGPQVLVGLSLVFLFLLVSRSTYGQSRHVFWIGSEDSSEVRGSSIFRYTVDTGDVDTLVRAADLEAYYDYMVPAWFSHIMVDTIDDRIYWTAGGLTGYQGSALGAILTASLDGDDVFYILSYTLCGPGGPTDLEYDAPNEALYWGDRSDCGGDGYGLYSTYYWDAWFIDRAGAGYLVEHIELDRHNGFLYWVSNDEPISQYARLPGILRAPVADLSQAEYIVSGCVDDIVLAHALSKIYWAPCGNNQIRRANLDGSRREPALLVEGEVHLAIDNVQGKIYWTEFETGKLRRADLDWKNAEVLLTGLVRPTSLALNFGTESSVSTAEPAAISPGGLVVTGIYPNPVRESATIAFTLAEPAVVTVEIYDGLARRVELVASGTYSPGSYDVPWNVTGHAAGVYFCRVTAGGQTRTRAFVVN